jgi:thiazole synthase ThiGH ThiG subunit
MAKAFAKAVEAAEEGLAAGPRAARRTADASSPLTGFLWEK